MLVDDWLNCGTGQNYPHPHPLLLVGVQTKIMNGIVFVLEHPTVPEIRKLNRVVRETGTGEWSW